MSFHLQMDKNFGAISSNTSLQFGSVTQSCPTLWNPMDCSTPGIPVHHQLLELTQTYLHWVGDGIDHLILCRPLLLPPSIFPSIRVFSNKSVFASGGCSIGVSAPILPMNIQDWFPLGLTGWISLQSKDSQEFSPTPPFKSISSLVLSFLCSPTLTTIHDNWKKSLLWLDRPLSAK